MKKTKGEILIQNGFENHNQEYFLLGATIVEGKISVGDNIFISPEVFLNICTIEMPFPEKKNNVIIGINRESLKNLKPNLLYKNSYKIV